MKIYPFKAIYPQSNLLASVDSFLGTVKMKFPEFVQSGYFQKHKKEGLYLYKISKNETDHIGLISSTDINEITKGNILKHENTLPQKEQETMNYILQRQAQIKPVLLCHKPNKKISALYTKILSKQKPFHTAHAESKDVTHSFYAIENKEHVRELQKLFKSEVPKCYIADGHHRCSTTTILHNNKKDNKSILDFSKMLTAFFSFDELQILDYNRIVLLEPDLTYTQIMASFAGLFKITPLEQAIKPGKKHELTCYINNEWYALEWKSNVLRKHSEDIVLDVDLFNKLILNEVLGGEKVRRKVKYVDGAVGVQGLIEKASKFERAIGFCLFPVHMDEFVALSDMGKMLPPKSTWFEPRLHNGLLVQSFLK